MEPNRESTKRATFKISTKPPTDSISKGKYSQ